MGYEKGDLKKMLEAFGSIEDRFLKLREDIIVRDYRTSRGKEFAVHGFCRRLHSLALTTQNVFGMLPPDYDGVPKKDVLDNVTIQVQAFVFNTFGAIDNLAWCWFYEKGLTRRNGKDVPASWVALSPENEFLVPTLSQPFRDHIAELKTWFDIIEGYRHALAHRIPLYIPPYSVRENKAAEYRDLDAKITDALSRQAWDELEKHEADQLAMHAFHPLMMHSFEEGARTISFHPQMVADFGLVEVLGRRMLDELNSLEPKAN
jgi:hypothetical protein